MTTLLVVLYVLVALILVFLLNNIERDTKKMGDDEYLAFIAILSFLWLPALLIFVVVGVFIYPIYLLFGNKDDTPDTEDEDNDGVDYDGNEDMVDADDYDEDGAE